MEFKNVGRFKVSGLFFRKLQPLEGVNLFRDMVVLDVQYDINEDVRSYVAIHPQFDPIKVGEMLPEYVAMFHDGTSTPTWERVASPRWMLASSESTVEAARKKAAS